MRARFFGTIMLFALAAQSHADTIAIIGTGNVAKALGPEFAAQGHTIIYGSRQPGAEKALALIAETSGDASAALPKDAVVDAEIVVLAVPGMLVSEIIQGLGDLSGKIIIDPTNPIIGDWRSEMSMGVETSNAVIIQEAVPDAFVVKAFNALSWEQMLNPDGAITIPLAGNSDEAKQRVAELVSGMGLEPLDLGTVENAHWLEGMTLLWLNNRFSSRPNFEYHLRTID